MLNKLPSGMANGTIVPYEVEFNSVDCLNTIAIKKGEKLLTPHLFKTFIQYPDQQALAVYLFLYKAISTFIARIRILHC